MSTTPRADDTLQRAIGRMEGKMDAVLLGQQTMAATINDHDVRIRKLEESHAEGSGQKKTIFAVIGAASGAAGAALMKFLGIH